MPRRSSGQTDPNSDKMARPPSSGKVGKASDASNSATTSITSYTSKASAAGTMDTTKAATSSGQSTGQSEEKLALTRRNLWNKPIVRIERYTDGDTSKQSSSVSSRAGMLDVSARKEFIDAYDRSDITAEQANRALYALSTLLDEKTQSKHLKRLTDAKPHEQHQIISDIHKKYQVGVDLSGPECVRLVNAVVNLVKLEEKARDSEEKVTEAEDKARGSEEKAREPDGKTRQTMKTAREADLFRGINFGGGILSREEFLSIDAMIDPISGEGEGEDQ